MASNLFETNEAVSYIIHELETHPEVVPISCATEVSNEGIEIDNIVVSSEGYYSFILHLFYFIVADILFQQFIF